MGKAYTWENLQARGISYYPNRDRTGLEQLRDQPATNHIKLEVALPELRRQREAKEALAKQKEAAQKARPSSRKRSRRRCRKGSISLPSA